MKANELMIGDWVYLADPDTNKNEIIKVSRTDLSNEIVKYLKPIPLTPEILEKNGFKKYGGEYANIQEWFVRVNGTIVSICQDTFDDKFFIKTIEINYVHQLQHALKLCGIEKEIIL